ncbi:MAG TPA: hypothetical protein PK956_12000 [Burkholderiaceae bacterium]|mgnify:CR=1 FL=1|jgi:hypothetical protein|nr:hypothetical protein [Burkholderiaceae bacterium]
MRRSALIVSLSLVALAGCASQPRQAETVWVTVVEVYSPESLRQSWNRPLAARAGAAGLGEADVAAGRLLRVACGLGSDYVWGSYARLPAGMAVRRDEILELRVDDPGTDDRMGLNPVVRRVAEFPFPGSLRAYEFIPDWRERGLSANIERIALAPAQRGRYVISHSYYSIKCRQQ